jgi:hypothetical protein
MDDVAFDVRDHAQSAPADLAARFNRDARRLEGLKGGGLCGDS